MQRKQEKIDKEWADFAQFLADQGYWEQDIMSGLDELKKSGKLTVSPNFSERLVWGLANRMGEVQQTTERLASEWFDPLAWKVTAKWLATAPVSYAGDVVGTSFEPVAAAVSPLIQSGIKKLGQEENVAKLGSEWEEIRQKYPNFADFVEGTANISSLLPFSPKATTPIKEGIKTVWAKTLQTAETLAPNLTKQAKKLVSQADMGFRKQAEEIALPKLSEMGMREKQKVTGDVIETKPWLFKKEELVRSPQEALAIEEVSRMLKEGKLKKWGTELQKSTAISDEITGLAEALKWRLDNTPNPVNIPKAEIETLLDTISKNIDRNPFLKAGELDRSAQQIIKNIREQLTKDSYTPSELLDIRKQLDADIKTYKGEKAFSPDIENAFSTTLRDIRQGINNKISELVPDVEVRNFLDRQSALYIARDNVDLKWSKQANSLIGRTLTKIQSATWIPRTEIIELTTALGLLGASSLAPIVTPIAVWAVAFSGGKKALWAILSPKNKTRLANVLTKLDEAIKKNPKDLELRKAKELLTNLPKNGNTSTNIRRPSNNRSSNPQSVKKPEKVTIVKPSPQVKPVEKVETMTKWEAILYRKNGKIYAKDNQATRDALKRSGIDIEPDGEIKKQLTFYPEDDFRPDVTPKTVKPVEKTVKPKNLTEWKQSATMNDMETKKLIEEARKYKSAEEFIKAQGQPMYHWTNAIFDKFDISKIWSQTDEWIWWRWFYFAPDKEMARIAPWGNWTKYVKEVYVDKNKLFDISKYKDVAKLADDLDMWEWNFTMWTDWIIRPNYSQVRQFTSHIEDLWFDWVLVNRRWKWTELVIFNPKNIKTKEELYKIYENSKSLK